LNSSKTPRTYRLWHIFIDEGRHYRIGGVTLLG